jgi:CheY-like chemotaxis protein
MSNADVTNWTVLVVDDEPDNIGVVEIILNFHGAKIHTAANGKEGLACLETINPTVILMDLSMPEMDGWEMFKRVRQNAATKHIPVIALTAHALPDDVTRIEAAGFDAYILKPLRLATFLLEIRKCLEAVQQVKKNEL